MKLFFACALGLILWLPINSDAQFAFTTNSDGSLNIAYYSGTNSVVVIPDTTNGLPITTIGAMSLWSSPHPITSLTIGNNITSIGSSILFNGSSLTNVIFGTNVTHIGIRAFNSCPKLTGITLPDSLTNIDDYSFEYCSSLRNVVIGNNVTYIGSCAFRTCSAMTNLILGTNVVTLNVNAFGYCTNLTTVTVPDSITNVPGDLFFACTGLTNVVLGNGLTNLPQYMFWDCAKLASITFGTNIINITSGAFEDCFSIKSLFFTGNAPEVSSNEFQKALAYYLPGTTGWSNTFSGVPTAVWLPAANPDTVSAYGQTNSFGFTVGWASGQTVVIDECTNLAGTAWVPIETNTIAGGSFHFNDPLWTNNLSRFYRVRSP